MTEELEYADKTPDVQGGCPSNTERSCQSEQGEICVCACVFSGIKHIIFSACIITFTSLKFFQNCIGSSNTKTKVAQYYYGFLNVAL